MVGRDVRPGNRASYREMSRSQPRANHVQMRHNQDTPVAGNNGTGRLTLRQAGSGTACSTSSQRP